MADTEEVPEQFSEENLKKLHEEKKKDKKSKKASSDKKKPNKEKPEPTTFNGLVRLINAF